MKIDFMLAGIERIRHMADEGMLDDLYGRGYNILLDNSSITQGILAPEYKFPVRTLPSQSEFTN
ncbi:hypothetical protein [Xenorhabdus szentirmaii]|nr:hypothetical protein [Xenorhabdus sp. M]